MTKQFRNIKHRTLEKRYMNCRQKLICEIHIDCFAMTTECKMKKKQWKEDYIVWVFCDITKFMLSALKQKAIKPNTKVYLHC